MQRCAKRAASEPPALHATEEESIAETPKATIEAGLDPLQVQSEDREIKRLREEVGIFKDRYKATKIRLRSILETRELRSLKELLPVQSAEVGEAANLRDERYAEHQGAETELRELEDRRSALQSELRKLGVKFKAHKTLVAELQMRYEAAEKTWLAKDAELVKMTGRIKVLEGNVANNPVSASKGGSDSDSQSDFDAGSERIREGTHGLIEGSENDPNEDSEYEIRTRRQSKVRHNHNLRSRRGRATFSRYRQAVFDDEDF